MKPRTINLRLRARLTAVCLLAGAAWVTPKTFSATMQLASTNVTTGTNFAVPLTLNSGTSALGGYAVTVSFNTNVLQFVSVLGGNGAFAAPPTVVNTTVPGQVRYVHQQMASITSPTGTVVVSRINFNVIGPTGSSSALPVSDASADNTDGLAIPITSITNGLVGIGAPPQLAVSPVALDFGTIATGTTSQRVFVLSNSGVTTVSNGTAAVGTPFMIVSGQQFSVPSLGSTNVVAFAPSSAGAFTSLVVFATANGGTSTNQVTGTAAIAPAASFTASPANGPAPLLVNFTDASSGTVTNRLWSFGDTGTSTLASPSHTYSNVGVYSVSLTVFGPVGSSTTNAPTLITVTNVLPVAGFTPSSTNGGVPLLVFFTDASTGTITDRLWSFGDGATSGGLAPMHTYATAGVFSVSLTVSGPTGSNTLNRPGLITVTNVPPRAGFTASPANGIAPLQVSFIDASTGTITNRLWNFGDGGSSATTNPSHTYTNAGSYSVTLTVFGPTGTDALTKPDLIVVTNTPTVADLEVIELGSPSPVVVASNLTYTITVTNHGPATATSLTLTDALPASVSFVSASDECTNIAGLVVCDLASLSSGEATNVTLVVMPTVEGTLTNIASAAAAEADPNPTNNTAIAVTQVFNVPPPPHDLAVVKLKAPKKVELGATTMTKVGKFTVTVQNLGPQTETIPDLATLNELVTVEVDTLGTNCASFSAALVPPKQSFPISLAPNKKLKLAFQGAFNCANDPAATSKTAVHNDYRTMAAVDLGALAEVDTASANDLCPRPPSGSDPGCGNRTTSGTFGADALTDVVIK